MSEQKPSDSPILRICEGGIGSQPAGESSQGYPLVLDLPDGPVLLHFPHPPILTGVSADTLGIASLDGQGRVSRNWGLATVAPPLQMPGSLLNGPLGPLVEKVLAGEGGMLFHEGYRYLGGGAPGAWFVLVVNAQEERQARQQADRSWRVANALRRFGKALSSHQAVRPLCGAAVQEIASSTELAAALMWVLEEEPAQFELVASVGVNRQGKLVLATLNPDCPGGSAADLVAASRQPCFIDSVHRNLLTQDLEGRFCYLRPGAVAVLPLVVSDRLLGVLELVGRDGDPLFEENKELFVTLAEHLSLAVNSAQLFETFQRLASHDPLTGIANHRAMQEFLHARIAEIQRTGQSVGVVMADVDHFRSFNEEEGHDVGDEVLRRVATALKECLRPYDLAARYGGEEFTVVMPGTNRDGVLAAAERMRKSVEGIRVQTPSGHLRQVTISLGCAIAPENANEAPAVLRAADVALYRAKRSGRNRAEVYDGTLALDLPEEAPLISYDEWLNEDEKVAAAARMRRLGSSVDQIAAAVGFTPAQRRMMEGMLCVLDLYERSAVDKDLRSRMEASAEFRALLPNLDRMASRFDQEGTTIPLLARAAAWLVATDGGEAEDLGRFDPNIVELFGGERRAA